MNAKNRGAEKEKTNMVRIIIVLAGFAALLFGTNLFNLTYGIKNLSIFTFVMIVVPILYIIIAGFLLGYLSLWSIKKGICFALILTFLSWGISSLAATIISPESITAQVQTQDEIMSELYDELDRKAYEMMLEQGLIEEGDVITHEPAMGAIPESIDGEYSEMYVGIVESDPTMELMSIILDFIFAFGAGFAGYKVKNMVKKKRLQNG